MSDFRLTPGFEDVWRPPVSQRIVRPQALIRPSRSTSGEVRARLQRIVSHAPEVMVKVTGRTRDAGHLRAHLDYISRNGALDLEGADGALVAGRREVAELAEGWAATALGDRCRRADSPISLSVVLSMPAGTNEVAVRDAARAFAADMFAGRHDYVFTLHTDTPRPHVHLSICSRGYASERLNPKKADLELWRQTFAQALRDRGVEAEATPRRTRGISRKAERGPIRRMRERSESGRGEASRVRRAAYQEAAKAAFLGENSRPIWERRLLERQAIIRQTYLAQAQLLAGSPYPEDRALAVKVQAFVRSLPAPDSQRLALARELRAASRELRPPPERGRDRSP